MTSRANSLLRTAITPVWLIALVGAIAFAVGTVFLGLWQWERTQDILAAERAANSAPIALTEIVGEDGTWDNRNIGRPVVVDGSFTTDEVLMPNREWQGERGYWTLTRLELLDGRSVAVNRGWLPDGTVSPPILGSATSIAGVLHPNEEFYAGANSSGEIVTVDSNALANRWGVPLISGYVMMQEQDPSLQAADAPAPVIIAPTVQVGDAPFPLQNFVYAFQWWLFGAFALGLYGWWLWRESARPAQADRPLV